MVLGTLGASLTASNLEAKAVIRAGDGAITKAKTRSEKQSLLIVRASHWNKTNF